MQRIAYLGPAGTFTEAALGQLPGGLAAVAVPAVSQSAAIAMVRSGEVDAACVPIENSVEGPVVPTLDALIEGGVDGDLVPDAASGGRVRIVAETELEISFSLAVRPGTGWSDIGRVGSHSHGYAQVRAWLADRLPAAAISITSSTAAAAEQVAAGTLDAAICPALAAERLGLTQLATELADVPGARTRFVLVTAAAPPPPRTGADRTSVVLALPNHPGSLVGAMTEFAIRGIDLTRIESRPLRTQIGSYRFYLDCAGHIDDPAVAEALAALHRQGTGVHFLGSWPAFGAVGSPPPDPSSARLWVAGVRDGRNGSAL